MKILRIVCATCLITYCTETFAIIGWIKKATSTVSDTAKKLGNTVNDGLKKAGDGIKDAANFIGDRFKDTKATRAIDYAARKAALEASLTVATGVLTAAEKISTGTLDAAYETSKLGVTAAEQFLNQVVQNVAYASLKGPAEAAKGVLEGAKQTSLGVLQGSQWIVNNSLGQLDVYCIHYDGNLRDLTQLKLGNVLVRGKIIQSFETQMSLDLSNPISSIESFAKGIGKMMESAFISPQKAKIEDKIKEETKTAMPLNQAFEKVNQAAAQAALLETQVQALQPPAQVPLAQKAAQDAEKQMIEEEKKLEALAAQARKTIEQIASKSMEELITYLDKNGQNKNRKNILYKQDLLRRKLALSNEIKKIEQQAAAPEAMVKK